MCISEGYFGNRKHIHASSTLFETNVQLGPLKQNEGLKGS
jgi:hypothetical protein